jgi:hypothetical protein
MRLLPALLLATTLPSPLQSRAEEKPSTASVPLTLEQFPTAETHHMMKVAIDNFDCFGQWAHLRGFTPMDQQTVVRMNRDTLYSSIVLDLTEPATLTKGDTQSRYQSVLVMNEGHFAKLVAYEPGEYELTQEAMGSRYVAIIARTLVDAEDPDDVVAAHKAQNGLGVKQKSKGQFDVPNWDPEALGEMREALKTRGNYLPNRDKSFGASIEDVDPIDHLVATADTWGGWKPENAVYRNFVPQENDGKTAYTVTLEDVPAGDNAFWSISVYNEEGFFQENESGKYVVNSRKAEADKDGAVTIHFGGDSSRPNFLPIMPGWNYMLRIYLPKKAYFNGMWDAPEAQAAK